VGRLLPVRGERSHCYLISLVARGSDDVNVSLRPWRTGRRDGQLRLYL
jgi:hypothetical protein